jgi:hypothetical protein
MRTETITLDARLNDSDRRLIAAAAQSHASERAAAEKGPDPLAYGSRNTRLAYTSGLRELERRLLVMATETERWRVSLATVLQSVPILPLSRKAGIVPPAGIRNLAMRDQFYLVKVTGQPSLSGGVRIASLRHALEFRAVGSAAVRQPAVHAFFPGAGARRYGVADVLVGLRSTLRFWVAVTPGGTLIGSADQIPRSVLEDLVYGPVRYRFGKTRAVGAGLGRTKVEWYYPGERIASGATLESLLVLRVPKGSGPCRVETAVEADVILPTLLQPLLGRHRLLRAARHIRLPAVMLGLGPGLSPR